MGVAVNTSVNTAGVVNKANPVFVGAVELVTAAVTVNSTPCVAVGAGNTAILDVVPDAAVTVSVGVSPGAGKFVAVAVDTDVAVSVGKGVMVGSGVSVAVAV